MPPKGRNAEDLNDLRLRSRQDYLGKREEQSLLLLAKQVEEEAEEQRSNKKLSKQELESFRHNRELLELVRSRQAVDEHRDGYLLPDSTLSDKTQVLTRRDEKNNHISEVEQWENEQVSKIRSQIKTKDKEQEEDYEYVFDEDVGIKWDAANYVDPETQQLKQTLDLAEKRAKTMKEVRESLPVFSFKEQLISAVADHQILIICGETGSGKTTQLTQYLHEAGYTKQGKIGCTQPRRVAAMSVAKRVAEEFGCRLGSEVGYSVRFDVKTSPKTIIQYMTDGMLLRELLTEADLGEYSAVIIDEAHERSVATDILMAILKDLTRLRPDFKLLISSATMNAEKFAKYFDDAPIFNIPGRMYPVSIYNVPTPESDYLKASLTTIYQIHLSQPRGDILVFLTGQEEIESAQQNIEETSRKLGSRAPELIVCPIYSALPSDLQAKIFEPTPPKARKVVLATNIAETSLTIDGIVYVIDPGFSKENSYNAQTGMESLTTQVISRASAGQRAGRAGRTGPGSCFRLYTKWSYYNELLEETQPELQRTNMTGTLLLLLSLNITNLLDFDFLDPPPAETVTKSLELLYSLGALNDKGELTKVGRQLSTFPINPMLARSLLAAETYSCIDSVLSIISMLGEYGSLFFRPKDQKVAADHARARFTDKEGGDHLTLLRIWNEWVDSDYSIAFCKENFIQTRSMNQARNVREQLEKLCDQAGIDPAASGNTDSVAIRKAITAGYFPNAARLQRDGQSYQNLKSRTQAFIHPSSTLSQERPRWVVYYELQLTSKEYMRGVMPIDPAYLTEAAPHFYKAEDMEKFGVDKKTSKGRGKVGV